MAEKNVASFSEDKAKSCSAEPPTKGRSTELALSHDMEDSSSPLQAMESSPAQAMEDEDSTTDQERSDPVAAPRSSRPSKSSDAAHIATVRHGGSELSDDRLDRSLASGDNDSERESCSEDSRADQLYSEFMSKDEMDYDSKDDPDFEQSENEDTGDSEDDLDSQDSQEETELDLKCPEDCNDDFKLLALDVVAKRSKLLQVKVRVMHQMRDDELAAMRHQFKYLGDWVEKSMDEQFAALTRINLELEKVELSLIIIDEIEVSKKEFNDFMATPSETPRTRRGQAYADKFNAIAETVETLFTSVRTKWNGYFNNPTNQ